MFNIVIFYLFIHFIYFLSIKLQAENIYNDEDPEAPVGDLEQSAA